VYRQTNLLEVIRTTHPSRFLASRLNGGDKQSGQEATDREDDNDFDSSKGAIALA
jgi:hypothetical protein